MFIFHSSPEQHVICRDQIEPEPPLEPRWYEVSGGRRPLSGPDHTEMGASPVASSSGSVGPWGSTWPAAYTASSPCGTWNDKDDRAVIIMRNPGGTKMTRR